MKRFAVIVPVIVIAAAMLWSVSADGQVGRSSSVIDTPHNLSVSGPGSIRAVTEQRVCVFCHTSHSTSPVQPQWNRFQTIGAYTVYTSSSLDALPGQPTGASKMCLSCHDGTIALGSVVSKDQTIQLTAGQTTMPWGDANLGTDLSDDHPISFRYDSALAGRDPKLRPPLGLTGAVRLDANRELQCTTCHNVHNNTFGDFMAIDNTNSQLCTTCHQISSTTVLEHKDCRSCHTVHTAPSGPFLLKQANERATCLTCHDGSTPAPNIATDMNKPSVHDTDSPSDPPDPIPNHVSCADCHEPHTMADGSVSAPNLPPSFGSIDGITSSGAPTQQAQFEYEVCFKCHGDQSALQPTISRQIVQNNTRQEFDPSAISFHPVVATGRNSDMPSLKPGMTSASLIYCTDCHSSDTVSAKETGGAHGSIFRPLLKANYATADRVSESASAYALCYQCHERTSILNNESFSLHKLHIVDERSSCSACHDAHGISSAQGSSQNNSHLINFDTSVVFPSRRRMGTGPIFIDRGARAGSCTLSCHGKDHKNKRYNQFSD